MKIKSTDLKIGDIMASGERVKYVKPLLSKILVSLEKNGKTRIANWNRYSTLFIKERS